MALIKCRECGTQVSSSAKSCPSCGAAVKRDGLGFFGWLAIGIIGLFVAVGYSGGSKISPEVEAAMDLCRSTHDVVKAKLKAPATAKFPDCTFDFSEYEVRATPDKNTYWISGYVDSQNGFGALVRSRYIVKFERGNVRADWMITDVAVD